MTRFIRLTNIVLNTSKIIKIESLKSTYIMHISDHYTTGFFLITFGTINSTNNRIVICKDDNPIDYKIVTNWINQIKSDS